MDKRVYKDFEPRFELAEDQSTIVLRIDVLGFKKEQLRVQLDSTGTIKVSGERPLTESIGDNRWSRFRKDFPLPPNCSPSGIRARFDNGQLYVLIPKLPTPLPPPPPQIAATEGPASAVTAAGGMERAPPDADTSRWVAGEKPPREQSEAFPRNDRREFRQKWNTNGGSGFDSGIRRSRKGTVIKTMLALLVLAGVGIAIYFHYMIAKDAAGPIIGGEGAVTRTD